MIVSRMKIRDIPASTRGARSSKYAGIVADALKLPEGESLAVSFDDKDGKYPSNNLVFSIRKGSFAAMGLDARSVTANGEKTVYITRKAVEADA